MTVQMDQDAVDKRRAFLINQLSDTDQMMSRILEDLVHSLVARGVIAWDDFPQGARERLHLRARVRKELSDLGRIERGQL